MKRNYYYPRISFQNNRKIVVQKTIYKCNNHCIFCVIPDCFSDDEKGGQAPTTEEFKKIIDRYSEDGKSPDIISFTSAEPTLRSDIIYLLEYAIGKYPGAEIQLLTNGRMFSHKQYVARFRHLLPRIGVHIPIHGPNREVHDKLTLARKSFEQTVEGIKNVFDAFPAARINIRILVHKQNYRHLDKTIAFIIKYFPKVNSIILIYISMIGYAKKNYSDLFLKFADLKVVLSNVLRTYSDRASFLLFHVPYCITDQEFWDLNAGRTLSEEQMEFPEQCSGCLMQEKCCGFWKSTFNAELFAGVVPVK